MGLLGAVGTGLMTYGTMAHQENMKTMENELAIERAQRLAELQRSYAEKDRTDSKSRFDDARNKLTGDAANAQYGDALKAYENAEGMTPEDKQTGIDHVKGLIGSHRPEGKAAAQIDARAALEVGDKERGVLANQALQTMTRDEQVEATLGLRKDIASQTNAIKQRGQDVRSDIANNRILFGGKGGGASGGSRYSPDDIKALSTEKKDAEKIVYGKDFAELSPEQQSFWKGKLDSINQEIGRSRFFANRPQQLTEADRKSLIDAYWSGDAERAGKAIKVIDFAFGEGSARRILEDYTSGIQTPGEGMETGREPDAGKGSGSSKGGSRGAAAAKKQDDQNLIFRGEKDGRLEFINKETGEIVYREPPEQNKIKGALGLVGSVLK